MSILSILLSEFNQRAGLRLIHSQPQDGLINPSQFSLISDLVLPREEFCNKMLAIEFKSKYFIVGMPLISINTNTDKTYQREKYIYSINIMIQKEVYFSNLEIYKEIARKLAFFFRALEQTYHLIYSNKTTIEYIKETLKLILKNINQTKQCNLTHLSHHYTFMNFKFSPFELAESIQDKNNKCSTITPNSVPITNLSRAEVDKINSKLGKVLMEYAYKGEYSMKKIYKTQDKYEEDYINKYYQKAIKMGIVFMVDIFDIHNRYALTPEILKYSTKSREHRQVFSKACRAMMVMTEQFDDTESFQDSMNNSNSIENKILYLFFQVQRKIPIKKTIQKNLNRFNEINLLKWVRLGQILKIIVRVEEIIVYSDANTYLYQNTRERQIIHRINSNESVSSDYITLDSIRQYCPTLLWDTDGTHFDESLAQSMDRIFYEKLKNLATIEQMCLQLKIDRETLLKMSKKQLRNVLLTTS